MQYSRVLNGLPNRFTKVRQQTRVHDVQDGITKQQTKSDDNNIMSILMYKSATVHYVPKIAG